MPQRATAPLILLVEDFADAREMYRDYLEFSGFRVETAYDGRDAIEKARTVNPDLVLMDLSLPGIDGWEATRILKADKTTRHLTIVALSAHALAAEGSSPLRRTRVSTMTAGPFAGRTMMTLAARADVAPNHQVDASEDDERESAHARCRLGGAHERPRRPRIGAAGETPQILLRDRARPKNPTQLAHQGHLAPERLRRVRARRSPRQIFIVPFDRAGQPAVARFLDAAESEGRVERTRRIRKTPARGEQRRRAPDPCGDGSGPHRPAPADRHSTPCPASPSRRRARPRR